MAETGLEVFDSSLQKTNIWFKEVMTELRWENRQWAYLALRTVLHTLRDRLTVQEAADLGAQLPMIVRGFYFEGWTPKGKPVKFSRDEFFQSFGNGLPDTVKNADPERIVKAVFKTLSKRISDGEIGDIRNLMPKDLEDLWPDS